MLFNSYTFIFAFLPAIVVLLLLIRTSPIKHRQNVLLLASLIFYSLFGIKVLFFLLLSIIHNFFFAKSISRSENGKRKLIFILSLSFNLIFLGYFKYSYFILSTLNDLTGAGLVLNKVLMPIGISFFTFQQISYLVDLYRKEATVISFSRHLFFVSFFPVVVSGPILRLNELNHSLEKDDSLTIRLENVNIGLTLFAIGLFKKIILGDNLAFYANPAFVAADNGATLTLLEAWGGILAYTFQLYFDFSGYSDMAIGVARIFGVILPANFDSPYKARSISEFWRRWHMTLSRFLRDYLYIGLLGGNRHCKLRTYFNLFLTMVLGGIWHGAGWTFIVWGALFGFYLSVNHFWRDLKIKFNLSRFDHQLRHAYLSLTFISVMIGWIFFRANTLSGAMQFLKGMLGFNGIVFPSFWENKIPLIKPALLNIGITFGDSGIFQIREFRWLIASFIIVFLLPNSMEFLRNHQVALAIKFDENKRIAWRPNIKFAVLTAALLSLALIFVAKKSEFMYMAF